MLRLLRLSVLSLLLLVALPRTGSATTVIEITLDQMTRASAVVLYGVVTSSRVEAINGNERHLRTLVDVRIDDLLHGPQGMKTIQLQLMGGRLGNWAMMIPGMPTFIAGEEVVLFLEKTATNWALTGLSQGKFTVTAGADGQKQVTRKLDGLHFVQLTEKSGRPVAPRSHSDASRRQTLSGLLAEVRHILKTPAPKTP